MSLIDYLRETRGELKHVTWPSKTETVVFTALVIALSLFVAYFLGAFDFLFRFVLEKVLI